MSEFGEGRAICDPLEFIMQTGEVDSCNYHLQIDGVFCCLFIRSGLPDSDVLL